ncbi:hypothetical protein TUZN_1013 [Thermoproteus uzoniensis 768-20]|uniref:Uncharacterized protein n=1 Tax=Thermoproteus uzoniensis (strain 768-20) TaxID=999630 RepID=F2L698_THEU7|nr:hypothetical protein [Thermoproteus uzoniensis]AEA12494.1 hypothetical protein TUZN_1013 [Thermoproteus uzoniensis 768-20]
MLREVLLALHVTGVVGWAGLTAGGYYVLLGCGESGFPRYAKLVYLQFSSALLIFATGLAMASYYGLSRPPLWISLAIAIAAAMGVLEVVHLLAARAGYRAYMRAVRPLIPLWTAGYIAMIYLMVFKPT